MKNGAQDCLLKNDMSRAGLVAAILHAIERVTLAEQIERRTGKLAAANHELEREITQRGEAEAAVHTVPLRYGGR